MFIEMTARFYFHDLGALSFHFKANSCKQTHIDICYPYERETSDEIPSPVRVKKLESRDNEKHCCNVVTEAVLARK